MIKGWLEIPGVQAGHRTLAEQMTGLDDALHACPGRTVLDLGCAEGLIGIEFARAGAAHVGGCELQTRFVEVAQAQAAQAGVADRCDFYKYDLGAFCRVGVPGDFKGRGGADIVLALAIVHKLCDPTAALRNMAALARSRLVLRLPLGSRGEFHQKNNPQAQCNAPAVLLDCGMTLSVEVAGPRGEWVQHWVR